ncbi:glycosyltransferase [soil metagenome]
MLVLGLAMMGLLLSVVPAMVFRANLRSYQSPSRVPQDTQSSTAEISVLIPARNEERSIASAVESVLASQDVNLEVIVLDDGSTDETANLVAALALRDSRVTLLRGGILPEGWCGKQYACWKLAQVSQHPLLVFLDADVRLQPDGLSRLIGHFEQAGADLISGVPRQETSTFMEKLLIPLIHFLLLGFLPINRMRRSLHSAYAAGCGQIFLARRSAYEAARGHSAIRASLHDGIMLPRAFRLAGFKTDLCDLTDVATCRMYRNAGEVWHGLSKNATEGLAAPARIVPASILLLGGQVLPFVLLGVVRSTSLWAVLISSFAVAAAYLPRMLAAYRFQQSWTGAFLHPFGILTLLTIQWCAFFGSLLHRPMAWKGRVYHGSNGTANMPDHKCDEATLNADVEIMAVQVGAKIETRQLADSQ